jgi:hypothetical protein
MGPELLVGGGPERPPLGCQAEPQFLVFFKNLHIEITADFQSVLRLLRRQSPDKPQTASLIREDPYDPGARLIDSLKHSNMLVDFICLGCCSGSW